MARWIALGITLVCFGSCSFISTSTFRGVFAPIGVIVFGLVSLALFIHAKVSDTARPPISATLDPEVQMLMRKRAADRKAELERVAAISPASNNQRSEPGA